MSQKSEALYVWMPLGLKW